MTPEQQLKLQAFLDGELPETEARDVVLWTSRDPEAANLLSELRHTRQVLKSVDSGAKLPESREFFWSKVEREIQRLEPAADSARARPGWLNRFLVPLGAVAGLALVMVAASLRFGLLPAHATPDTETSTMDSGAFTYHDYQNGTTLVWVSYPAER
jgi:anti-sigma factor RsiW